MSLGSGCSILPLLSETVCLSILDKNSPAYLLLFLKFLRCSFFCLIHNIIIIETRNYSMNGVFSCIRRFKSRQVFCYTFNLTSFLSSEVSYCKTWLCSMPLFSILWQCSYSSFWPKFLDSDNNYRWQYLVSVLFFE